jgi:hypothetical protein
MISTLDPSPRPSGAPAAALLAQSVNGSPLIHSRGLVEQRGRRSPPAAHLPLCWRNQKCQRIPSKLS